MSKIQKKINPTRIWSQIQKNLMFIESRFLFKSLSGLHSILNTVPGLHSYEKLRNPLQMPMIHHSPFKTSNSVKFVTRKLLPDLKASPADWKGQEIICLFVTWEGQHDNWRSYNCVLIIWYKQSKRCDLFFWCMEFRIVYTLNSVDKKKQAPPMLNRGRLVVVGESKES